MESGRLRWLWILVGIAAVTVGVLLVMWLWPKLVANTPQGETPQGQTPTPSEPLEVAISNVTAGQTVSGTIDITLTVDDLSRVVRAEYFVDGQLAAVTYAYPFTFTLDTSTLSAGEHTITAKAYDKNGTAFDAAPVKITVAAQQVGGEAESEDAPQTSGGTARTSSTSTSQSTGTTGGNNNGGGNQNTGDTTAPTAPGNVALAANDGYTTNITWSASTDNVGVTGYQVYRDGAALGSVLSAGTTSYQDQTVVPGNTYEYAVKAFDAANNATLSNEPDITLVPTSMFITGDSPQFIDPTTDSYELGMKFRPLVDGKVSGVKFYKAPGSTGTHTGNLWKLNGEHMATVTFQNETASGWQQAVFDEPMDVIAGTTYIISYSIPEGKFAYIPNYFTSQGITTQYLTALAKGVEGDNGLFADNPDEFPTGSYNDTNYMVDALFIPNPGAAGPAAKPLDNSAVYAGFPGSNNTGVPVGKRLPTRDRGMQIYEDGAIVENIEMSGQVDIRADNVLIRNSKLNGFVYLDTDIPQYTNYTFTIRDVEINNGVNQRGAVSLGNFTLERVNIHGGQMSTLCGGNCTVTDSWFHGQYVPADQDWHLGGFLSNGGANMTVSGNTIACDTPNNQVGGGCSGDLNLFGDFAPIEDILLEGNFFLASPGATYCLNLGYNAFKTYGPQANNIDVLNNVFQRGTGGNCASVAVATDYMISGSPAPGNSWINNKWDDGTDIPAPF